MPGIVRRAPRLAASVGLAAALSLALGGLRPAAAAEISADDGMRIDGRAWHQHAGQFVASAGDVNGDGLGDVLVGTRETHRIGPGLHPQWSAYVVFGRAGGPGRRVRLDRLGAGGLRLYRTSDPGFAAGAGAGDVNGDGLDDVVLGTGADDRPDGGTAYVVYGRRRGAAIDVDHLGSSGFAIGGGRPARRGTAVAGAGDLDRDGFGDVLVSEPGAIPPGGEFGTGRVVVIYGARRSGAVDTSALGRRGAQVIGPGPFHTTSGAGPERTYSVEFGAAVAPAGDADGDGHGDVAVGAPYLGGREGGAFVVTALARGATVDLRSASTGWYAIAGRGGQAQGFALAPAGDQSGDGLDDLLVGELAGGPFTARSTGPSAAFMVHGRRDGTPADLGSLGPDGSVLLDAVSGDRAGASVASAGDLTGDGRRDLVVGAPLADPAGRRVAGSVFVVRGGALPPRVDLRAAAAMRFDGHAPYDLAGSSVAGLGDVNGDCRADVAISAARADPLRDQSGSVFALYGHGRPRPGCRAARAGAHR